MNKMSVQNDSQSEAFNIKEFILQVLSFKYYYILSLVICLMLSFLVNKLSPTIYEVHSIIGPVEDKRSSLLVSEDLFSGAGVFGQSRNLENDMNSLRTFSLVLSTIEKLNLEVGYYKESTGILKRKNQLFNDVHYSVKIDKSHIQPTNARFYIQVIDENSYRLTVLEKDVTIYNYLDNMTMGSINTLDIDTICNFNETISNIRFKFSVTHNKEFNTGDINQKGLYYFVLYHLDNLTKQYFSKHKVEPLSAKSSIIKVVSTGENKYLTIEFLNSYLQNYLDENLKKKNKIAFNTISFIDSQISEISDSLLVSESKLRDFRSANQVTDLSFQGQQALGQMTTIEAELSMLQIQERYYKYILDYFDKNQDIAGLAPPNAANVVDPIMNTLIMDLLNLNAQRSSILSNNTEKNLFLGQLENKIKLQKQSIIESVKNNLNTLNLSQNELTYRAEKLSKEISKLPRTELNMVSMQRQFNLTDAIYTFMLQKRSEAAITMAANTPDYEILEPASNLTSTIISPRKMINLLMAIFIALMIPSVFIILKKYFNDKFTSIADVEKMLNRSVINVIFKNKNKTESVVHELPASSISESFRNLRSSIFLKYKSQNKKTIMITSSQPMDGKSFVAYNLAASIASVGHKTIIVDCDLRLPTLHKKFKVENIKGLSNFIMNHSSISDITLKTNIENLYFIPSGPTLPNPAELLEAGYLDDFFESIGKDYDYIIIDATPTVIVADATPIIKYASIILLVCRNNYTRKDDFYDLIDYFRGNKIENVEVIYNDLDIKESRYGRYNSYYGIKR